MYFRASMLSSAFQQRWRASQNLSSKWSSLSFPTFFSRASMFTRGFHLFTTIAPRTDLGWLMKVWANSLTKSRSQRLLQSPWVNSPDIILTEKELTREIGHLDSVHISHLRDYMRGIILSYVKDKTLLRGIKIANLPKPCHPCPFQLPWERFPSKIHSQEPRNQPKRCVDSQAVSENLFLISGE